MTAKAIDIAREYYRLIQPIAARAAENDAALAPGEIARKLKSKSPTCPRPTLRGQRMSCWRRWKW